MTRVRRVEFAGVVALVVALVAATACRKEFATCYAGEYVACACDGGTNGFQQCNAAQDGFGACVCDGRVPGLDATPEADASAEAEAAAKIGFLQPCEKNEQCETGLCFPFNARGPRCTIPCKPTDTCPPPSPGCSNNGVCKSQ